MVDTLVVTLVVAVACAHAAWQLLPTVWRVPAAARMATRLAGNANTATGWRAALLKALRAPSAGCGDCGGRARCPAQSLPARSTAGNAPVWPGAVPAERHVSLDGVRLIASSRG